jgi:outer membrane protein assembly factor BamA
LSRFTLHILILSIPFLTLVRFPLAAQLQPHLAPASVNRSNIIFPKASVYDEIGENRTDILDLIRRVIKVKDADSIKKERLGPFYSIIPALGYTLVNGYIAVLASNVSFYTSNKKTKLSTIMLNGYYSEYHQYWGTLSTYIFSEKSRLIFIGDARMYKFPTRTFGLGGETLLSDAERIDYSYLKLSQLALKQALPNLYAGIGYHLDHHFDIDEKDLPPGKVTDFQRYGFSSFSISSGLSANLMYDTRKNLMNPTGGMFAYIRYRTNMKMLGSDSNWQSLLLEFRKYLPLSEENDNVLAFWSYNDITLAGNPPYLDLPSNGWDAYSNTARGYVSGRYRGKTFLYLESEYRYGILPSGLLGGVFFANVQSVTDWPSNKFNALIPGGGLGLRIKLNKHSNTNLAIDYAFGKEGSRGFFFSIGEVF